MTISFDKNFLKIYLIFRNFILSGSCSPKEVIVHLKHGSFPTVNPDGYPFPKNFIDVGIRENMYTLNLLSDGNNITYFMKNPKPGIWYALAYIKWEDPRIQKVEQQGKSQLVLKI